MNTGKDLETDRLFLLPGRDDRDNESFLRMLREEGNFRDFCGVDFSEYYLKNYDGYLGHRGGQRCLYSIFRKAEPERFIGYAGVHLDKGDYRLEFYISKPYRRKGYCYEACLTILDKFFNGRLFADGVNITADCIYSFAGTDNVASENCLKKLGFTKYDGNKLSWFDCLVEWKKGKIVSIAPLQDHILRKENFCEERALLCKVV